MKGAEPTNPVLWWTGQIPWENPAAAFDPTKLIGLSLAATPLRIETEDLITDLIWWPAGAHLHQMFGSRYAVIGSAVGVSEANGIGPPEAGTLEARLTVAPGPARFLPTHKGQGLPPSAIATLPTRFGSTKNLGYFALTPQSFTDFDGLIALDSTTYNRGGPLAATTGR